MTEVNEQAVRNIIYKLQGLWKECESPAAFKTAISCFAAYMFAINEDADGFFEFMAAETGKYLKEKRSRRKAMTEKMTIETLIEDFVPESNKWFWRDALFACAMSNYDSGSWSGYQQGVCEAKHSSMMSPVIRGALAAAEYHAEKEVRALEEQNRKEQEAKEQEKETDELRFVTLSEEILTMLSKEEESDAMNAVCRAAALQAFRSGSLVRSFAEAMSLWHASLPQNVPTHKEKKDD